MIKIRQVDVTMLDKPKSSSGAPRELSPRARERMEQERQLKRMLSRISDRDSVFELRLDENEKPLTVRQRLMKVAQEQGKEIVVRKSERGWLVGLATPDRRSRRGRRKASAS
jgi:CRISPR/Cas system-associated endoribonuclease Cas2